MLTRLYVDNYKCLVNFDFQAKPLQLFLGVNGTGKSTVFEVLSRLRDFVYQGRECVSLFPTRSLTRWQARELQTFELEVDGNGGHYRYRLEIEQDLQWNRCRVKRERLGFDDHPLFEASLGEGQLYRDDFTEGPPARFDWNRSGVAALAERPDNQRLTWFKDWIGRLYCLQLDPRRMSARSESEEAHPNRDLSNFASWYRHLSQEKQRAVNALAGSLAEVIEDFDSLDATREGENIRILKLRQKDAKSAEPLAFGFDELSDGQRVLIALYTLLHCSAGENVTLCLDEPENFIALAEIQPWLGLLSDFVDEGRIQAILVSHHPELINYLARDCGTQLRRVDNGPVQVRAFAPDAKSGLSDAELIARGWENE